MTGFDEAARGLGRFTEWQLLPHSNGNRRPFEGMVSFRDRLVAALRAGHGLGAGFDLSVSSGLVPRLTVGCPDPRSARWATRVLLPAYGRSAWVRRESSEIGRCVEIAWGRRVRAWPEPLRDPTDGLPAADGLVLALGGIGPGFSVRWGFSACPRTYRQPVRREEVVRARPPSDARPGPSIPGSSAVLRTAGPVSPSPLFWKANVSIRVLRTTSGAADLPERVQSAVESALRSGRANGIRFSRRRLLLPWGDPAFPISEDELVCVLPNGICDMGGLDATEARLLPILPLGRTAAGRVVGPPIEPGEGRHLAVLGETGMGKSSTLVALARKAVTFGGVVLFDPLGETARSFRAGLSDAERGRLVSVAPQERTSGINALEGIGPRESDPVLSDRRLNDIVHALRRVRSGRYAESTYWGPRLEEMLTRAVRAAAAMPYGTLADAHTLLATGGRTRQVVPPEAMEAVRELSDRIRERPEDAEGARRLLYEVVRSPTLERMLCERTPSFHAKDLVAPRRIAVISGEAAIVGESTARYLLAVYLALVWSELLARATNPKTFVVLDESQWFSHESLAEMLRMARRRNVHVVLATQTIGSLPETVADAVWTNVADFVAFRGSPEEARELARASHGLAVEDLLALPRGHAAVLLGKGNALEWLRTTGRPPNAGLVPSEEPRGPSDPHGTDVRSVKVETPPESVDAVLGWIAERARGCPPGERLRVGLAELRRSVDPTGAALREVGAALGRTGALLLRERENGSPVWVLDPARVPARPAGSRPAEGNPPSMEQGP